MEELNVMNEEIVNEVPVETVEEKANFFTTEKGQMTIVGLAGFAAGIGFRYAVKGVKSLGKKIFSGKKKEVKNVEDVVE